MIKNESVRIRIHLLVELLTTYKHLHSHLEHMSEVIETQMVESYMSTFQKKLPEIMESIHQHGSNQEKGRQIHIEQTATANSWYDFVKNPEELYRLSFPLRFLEKRNAVKKKIGRLSEELSSITIQNRFIAEQITIWEHSLETEVISEARESEAFRQYEKAASTFSRITDDITYLVSTLPELCPVSFSKADIDDFIKKLQRYEAA